MSLLTQLGAGERLGALSLLLLLLAVLTGVSLTQAGLLDRSADELESQSLPVLRQVNDVRRLVDEARGLEALQFLADSADERARLAHRLQQQRQRVAALLASQIRRAAWPQPAHDDEDQRLQAAVQHHLQQYWATQDKVLAAVAAAAVQPGQGEASTNPGAGQASALPGPAPTARRLLAIESQAAWGALDEALQRWYSHQESRAAGLAKASRSQAEWLRLGVGGLMALVLCATLTLLWRRWRPRGGSSGRSPGATGLSDAMDAIAMQSRLVALNAAVQAARSGAPSPAESAERIHLAREADALARRCDAARRKLRLGAPAVRASAFGSESGPTSTRGPDDGQHTQRARLAEHGD